MIDQECFLNIGEQFLYNLKHRTAILLSAQLTTGVKNFAIAVRIERVLSRHRKTKKNVLKDENATILNSQKRLMEGLQEFKEKTGLLVADSSISVGQEKSFLQVLNMQN